VHGSALDLIEARERLEHRRAGHQLLGDLRAPILSERVQLGVDLLDDLLEHLALPQRASAVYLHEQRRRGVELLQLVEHLPRQDALAHPLGPQHAKSLPLLGISVTEVGLDAVLQPLRLFRPVDEQLGPNVGGPKLAEVDHRRAVA